MFVMHRYRELYDFEMDNIITPRSLSLLEYLIQLPAAETSAVELNPGVEQIIRERFLDQVLWLKESCGIDFKWRKSGGDDRVYENRNFDLLENIIRKPADTSIDRVKFDLIHKCLGMSNFPS